MQSGLLSEDDSLSSMNLDMPPQHKLLEGINMQSTNTEYDLLLDDDNFMLDTNQDLPIRKPQSAYVIFGKMVRVII